MDNATISIVSERAGVSKTTISRYLNGKYEHMSEKTKLRIKDIIEELDYRPNIVARSLKSKKTGLIGVIVSDITNPVTINLVKGIIDHCTKEGYQVLTASSDEKTTKEKEYILSMVDRQVEGLIVNIVDFNDYDLLESLTSKGVKIVLADRTISAPFLDMVTTDNYTMTRKAIRALYDKGFGIVGLFSSDLLKSNVRLARYNAFLEESLEYVQNPHNLVYLFRGEKIDEYKCALKQFLALAEQNKKQKPAIFASTPMALLNLLSASQELDLCVPKDLGICGYDNLHWTQLVGGGISVIEQPFYDVGVESAKILIGRVREDFLDNNPAYVELKSRLIFRNSTNI